jgi:hypothetical protein
MIYNYLCIRLLEEIVGSGISGKEYPEPAGNECDVRCVNSRGNPETKLADRYDTRPGPNRMSWMIIESVDRPAFLRLRVILDIMAT